MIDIFISFKNTFNGEKTVDAEIAQKIYDQLTNMKYNVFMMNDTLQKSGAANYKRKIDEALSEASCIIVVGSKKEFLESEWVRYEWDTFLGEALAGRKQEKIFTYRIGDLGVADLPISLRKYQSFGQGEGKSLFAFVDSALSPQFEQEEDGTKRFLYPVVISKTENEEPYEAFFPDIDLKTEGNVEEEAYLFAAEFLKKYLAYALKYGYEYNLPTDVQAIKEKYPNDMVMLVYVDITPKMIKSAHDEQNEE